MNIPLLTLSPIGFISTPFTDKYAAPRQPGGAPSEGLIELLPGHNFEQALEDLEGFEKIWLIYWFHRNSGWRPKILPTRSALSSAEPGRTRRKRGLFSTRSPHRPNPLGLSLVSLLEIRGRSLRVADTDLLDGTPIFDIKPYLPYAEAFPDAGTGWLEEDGSEERFRIEISAPAWEQIEFLRHNFSVDLEQVFRPVLEQDPFPHPYKRVKQVAGNEFVMAVKSWRVLFSVSENFVHISGIRSGYSPEEILSATGDSLHEHAAHTAFYLRWATPNI